MKKIKTAEKSPATKPSVGKKLEAETQNPLRKKTNLYRGETPNFSNERVLGPNKVFRTESDFIDDSDDDEEISAELTEAGASSAQSVPDTSRDDFISEDREFELGKIGTEAAKGGFSDEEVDPSTKRENKLGNF